MLVWIVTYRRMLNSLRKHARRANSVVSDAARTSGLLALFTRLTTYKRRINFGNFVSFGICQDEVNQNFEITHPCPEKHVDTSSISWCLQCGSISFSCGRGTCGASSTWTFSFGIQESCTPPHRRSRTPRNEFWDEESEEAGSARA